MLLDVNIEKKQTNKQDKRNLLYFYTAMYTSTVETTEPTLVLIS